jgi:protein-S-isoprenylcysteine O-methyltransferase Ste14
LLNLRILSVAGYFLLVLSLVLLIFIHALFSSSPAVIAIQVLCVMLMTWARFTFGGRSFHLAANPTEGGLVTSGPYRYVRHPIYASALYFSWAGIGANLSLISALLGAGVLAGVLVRIFCEEQLVIEKYPEYADYARKTKRLLPFVF